MSNPVKIDILKISSITYDEPEDLKWRNGTFPFRSVADHKFTLKLQDGNSIEAGVFDLIVNGRREKHACISTQAGCKFACAMCTSGKRGFVRNLSAHEIVSEVESLAKQLNVTAFNQLVFMGIGEPLDNYEGFTGSIKNLIQGYPKYSGNISFATVGLPHRMMRLSEDISKGEIPSFRMMWLSLHAPTDQKRTEIMPVGNAYTVEETLASARKFSQAHPSTQVWINYLLFRGFNDSPEDAEKLAELLSGTENQFSVMVTEPNNDLPNYKRANRDDLETFKCYLKDSGMKNGISLFVAAGKDVAAGCGEFIFTPKQ